LKKLNFVRVIKQKTFARGFESHPKRLQQLLPTASTLLVMAYSGKAKE